MQVVDFFFSFGLSPFQRFLGFFDFKDLLPQVFIAVLRVDQI